jgi:hypothetical protein
MYGDRQRLSQDRLVITKTFRHVQKSARWCNERITKAAAHGYVLLRFRSILTQHPVSPGAGSTGRLAPVGCAVVGSAPAHHTIPYLETVGRRADLCDFAHHLVPKIDAAVSR